MLKATRKRIHHSYKQSAATLSARGLRGCSGTVCPQLTQRRSLFCRRRKIAHSTRSSTSARTTAGLNNHCSLPIPHTTAPARARRQIFSACSSRESPTASGSARFRRSAALDDSHGPCHTPAQVCQPVESPASGCSKHCAPRLPRKVRLPPTASLSPPCLSPRLSEQHISPRQRAATHTTPFCETNNTPFWALPQPRDAQSQSTAPSRLLHSPTATASSPTSHPAVPWPTRPPPQ